MSDPRRGRPPIYTRQQVLSAIACVQAAGGQPDGNNVKAALQAHFDVSSVIDAPRLGRDVERLLQEQDAERMRGLATILPEVVRAGLDALLGDLGTKLIAQQAALVAQMREEARREIAGLAQSCADLDAHRKADRERIAELETSVAALRAQMPLRHAVRSVRLDQGGPRRSARPAASPGPAAPAA